jgi:hypothetical protein
MDTETLTVTVNSPTSTLTVTAQPVSPPVVIPAGGGMFQYTLTVTNTGATPATVDLWALITGPATVDPLRGPRTITVGAGETVVKTVRQHIPSNAPAGTYTYTVNVGTFPSTLIDSDGFTFEKEALANVAGREGTERTGAGRTGAAATGGRLAATPATGARTSEAQAATVPPAEAWVLTWDEVDWVRTRIGSRTVPDEAAGSSTQGIAGEASASAASGAAATVGFPSEYALHPAYPNPFTDRATFDYDLPEAARVQIVAYDLLGREVSRLVDGSVEAGWHRAVLDGRSLPTGVYVVRMTVGGRAFTQRITLVR